MKIEEPGPLFRQIVHNNACNSSIGRYAVNKCDLTFRDAKIDLYVDSIIKLYSCINFVEMEINFF